LDVLSGLRGIVRVFKNTDLYGYSPDVVKEEDGHHETVGIHRHVIYDLTSGHLSIGDGQAGQR